MKALFALGFFFAITGACEGQVRGQAFAQPAAPQSHSPVVVAPKGGALGGFVTPNATSRPLGGVALPTFPPSGTAHHASHKSNAARYIGPVYYAPNALDTSYAPVTEPAPAAGEVDFDAPPPPPRFTRTQAAPLFTAPAPADDAPDENYFLIAYKNHSIYTAKSYWIDGETLHYITLNDTHNQASLTFIDQAETAKLNADHQ